MGNTNLVTYTNSGNIGFYKYNPTDKLYYRSVNGSVQKDYVTKKQYTTKNIIISYVDNGNISNDNKGRQELNNIGTGKGYYITDGYSIPPRSHYWVTDLDKRTEEEQL